jgi:ABC-type Fe3+ transport system permease subunit
MTWTRIRSTDFRSGATTRRACLAGPRGRTLLRVHVPLLWGSVLTAVILVFVDVLKELPATLILRPFNFETLAVRVYCFASDERLAEASTAALAIVLVRLLPVILLSGAIARTHPDRAAERSAAPSAALASSPSSSGA